jgi:hypothetical protein
MYAPFVISGILEESVTDKVAYTNTHALRTVLNGSLQLGDYGDITGIAFIFIVTSPDDAIHTEMFRFNRAKKTLEVHMRLPFEAVESASQSEVLHMMAQKYLQTMQERLPKKKIPHFDWERFVNDLRQLFEKQGWLEGVPAI